MKTNRTRLSACRLAAAALLLGIGGAASAGTLTMQGWLYGPGNHVNLSANPSYSGLAGGFKGTLTGMSNPMFNLSPVEMYCVDLEQFIDIQKSYSVRMPTDVPSANFTLRAVTDVFSIATSQRLTQLVSWSESDASRVNSSSASTALQLAIWNTLYEGDIEAARQALSSGDFVETSVATGAVAVRNAASDMLADSGSYRGAMKQLFVLKSDTQQDQLIWLESRDIPEPGTLALAGLAMLGLAGTVRRRQPG